MEKYKIADGIYYVSIPEADLRILCGCPPDTVKHLRKRGFMISKEKNGVKYESGPNAILLSDVTVQKGTFCNLTEFPILQMFYRQGMLIPGHPNNTGAKPMLIGLEDQVKSQEEYIYRGNYGLINKEEIRDTGVDEQTAAEMMRLKLKFAFGNIKQTGDLIERLIVDREIIHLKKGVYLHRKGFNHYEIYHGTERVNINLNLGENERYVSPINLGFHKIKRQYFSVVHTGEGDGWDYDRPCMGSILVYQGKIYLIDAGPGILNSLMALGVGINEIEGIFHTHAHDDHFAGLASLLRSDHLIKHFTTPLVRASVVKKLAALVSMEEERFSRFFDLIDLEIDTWNNIDGLEVKPVFSPHPVETNIFFFRTFWTGGYRSYAHFADIASKQVLETMTGKDGISRTQYEAYIKAYSETADIKKLDIGGGMIHGRAEDFSNDASKKILLSHKSEALSMEEKSIGSNATFGTADVLIPSRHDYSRDIIRTYIRSYFPEAKASDIHMLINCPTETINPGSIVVKRKQRIHNIYLLVNGVAEVMSDKNEHLGFLSPGSFVGELFTGQEQYSDSTVRAASFIRILKIPIEIYLQFIRSNELSEELERICSNREFIQSTPLFSESLSSLVQNQLVLHMKRVSVKKNNFINPRESRSLGIVEKGRIRIASDKKNIETVDRGRFFGEDSILLRAESVFSYQAVEDSHLVMIPEKSLAGIPIVQWKLFETFERRMKLFQARFTFEWFDSYSVSIPEIDAEHKKLFSLLAVLTETAESEGYTKNYAKNLDDLIEALHAHLENEEKILQKIAYPEIEFQKKEHKKIIAGMDSFRKTEEHSGSEERHFFTMMKDWILTHTLIEDRKYSAFFREKTKK
jgi:hemerythrin